MVHLQPSAASRRCELGAGGYQDTACTVSLQLPQWSAVLDRKAVLKPARKHTIYILNHSHLDLGYTDVLPKVEAKQIENLRKAIALARETADECAGLAIHLEYRSELGD